MKKLFLLMFLSVAIATSASAFPIDIEPYTMYTPYGTNVSLTGSDVAELDWLPGPGLAVNANPYSSNPDNPFEFLYQLHLGSFIFDDGTNIETPTLNGINGLTVNNYEFTAIGRVWDSATLGLGSTTLDLVDDPTGTKPNFLEIYADIYDGTASWGSQVDVDAGTGYNDGKLILSATPVFMDSIFTVNDTNGNSVLDNQDQGSGGTTIGYIVDWYDPNFFSFDSSGGNIYYVLQFDGTLTLPPNGVEAATMWDGTIPDYYTGSAPTATTSPDYLFKVDGNSHSAVAVVPEPGTFFLFGAGLISLSALVRRKKKF